MKVQGSAFYFANQVEATDAAFVPFFAWLRNATITANWPPQRILGPGASHRREIFISDLPDTWCGVVISARTTQFHHYVKRVGNVVTIEARNTGANPPVEVNFFCLRKDSFKGIYSHYYGSYAFNGFLYDLWGAYRHYVEIQCVAALELLGVEDDPEIKRAYSFRGKSNTAPMFSPKAFAAMVRELSTVTEVRLTTYSVDAPGDQPVANKIRNIHKVYRLQEAFPHLDNSMMDWIREKRDSAMRLLTNGETGVSGSVLGMTAEGDEKTVLFGHNLENQLNFNYDDIGTFDVATIHQNSCLAAMLAKLSNGVMFR